MDSEDYIEYQIKETKRLLHLYQERLHKLTSNSEELELIKKVNEMRKIEREEAVKCYYNGMRWSELVLHYNEHFINKINEYTIELQTLEKQQQDQ